MVILGYEPLCRAIAMADNGSLYNPFSIGIVVVMIINGSFNRLPQYMLISSNKTRSPLTNEIIKSKVKRW